MGNRITGIIGEKIAAKYLTKNKYKVLEKNYKNKIGEIDIIAKKDKTIIFIEVKTRKNLNYGYPYEAVNKRKRNKIINTAYCYIRQNKLNNTQYRFDIVEVYLNKKEKINHIKNAFWI
ncbi:YraN family protein [Thermohalobacter berrensis]|uniref:UPF0102 protein BET03_00875 n=1 Tax=Thermohalobacter berrensis TaxID=99594 RepID=A0A419TAD7_9FIRM|nr:YraN family protein [Thermohalobacter berrensis]RKD34417.1 YraN family protein [Thermohalobacter berrensis]